MKIIFVVLILVLCFGLSGYEIEFKYKILENDSVSYLVKYIEPTTDINQLDYMMIELGECLKFQNDTDELAFWLYILKINSFLVYTEGYEEAGNQIIKATNVWLRKQYFQHKE